MQIGDYIRYCRDYFAMSQQQMAEELGISQSYLSEIETGKKLPKKLRDRVLEKYPVTGELLLYLKEINAL